METMIFVFMCIGGFLSFSFLIPYKTKIERKKLLRDYSNVEKIIECNSSDWKLWFLRGLFIVGMVFSILQFWEFDENPSDSIRSVLVFASCFVLHFIVYLQLDRKYYFTETGFWIGKIYGTRIPYSSIESNKVWKTTAPFSGCYGNLKIRIWIEGDVFTAHFPVEKDEEEREESLRQVQQLLEWLPDTTEKRISSSKRKKLIHEGQLLILLGSMLITFFIVITLYNTDAYNLRDVKSAKVCQLEQGKNVNVDSIKTDDDGNMYYLLGDIGAVNVYNNNNKFQYAYRFPKGGSSGRPTMIVQKGKVYVKNRVEDVYLFEGDEYVERVAFRQVSQNLKEAFRHAESNSRGYSNKRRILQGDNGIFFVLLGIIMVVAGGTLYNRGRYSF